jgi:crossover junction endodeoxyribonuclease RuvC
MKLIGLDPGLAVTGWGIIEAVDNRLRYVADGTVRTDAQLALPLRLRQLFDGLAEVMHRYGPLEAAVEETFVNRNAASALKLGQARAISLLVPAQFGLPVAEYAPNVIKKTVVGAGHAAKQQVEMMVKTLLPGCLPQSADAADALATAICHAHQRTALDPATLDRAETAAARELVT